MLSSGGEGRGIAGLRREIVRDSRENVALWCFRGAPAATARSSATAEIARDADVGAHSLSL